MKRVIVVVIIFSLMLGSFSGKEVHGEISDEITLRLENGDFTLYNDAKMLSDGIVQLTELKYWQSGGVWYDNPVTVQNGIRVSFSYYAGEGEEATCGTADGIVVQFSNNNPSVGKAGQNLGFTGNGTFGVEFDSHRNHSDPSENHIAIIQDSVDNHIISVDDSVVDDKKWHEADIIYIDKVCYVYVDKVLKLKYEEIENIGEEVYLGITASTGDGYNKQYIKNLVMSTTAVKPLNGDIILHCSSGYEISLNSVDSIPITVTADTYEELAVIINSIEAQSANTGVVTIEDLSFVMPTKAITYPGSNMTYSKWTASGLLKVKGRTEGSTAIIISESGGESVTCQITVSDETSGGDISAESEGFCLGKEVSGSADSSVADFFPADWSLASTVYPVEIEVKEEDNGLYKLRIAIGVKKGNWLKEDSTWNEFKSNVKDFKAYTSRYKGISAYKKKWGLKSYDAITASGFKKKPQISVMAYYEGTFDKNKKLINSESEFATDASWKGSLSWQFTTPIGPLYLNLTPGAKISVNSSIEYDWEKEAFSFPGGKLTVTPSVSLEGGYGIDKVASVGAKGSLSFPISVIPCTKGELKASASVHCSLLFVIDFEKKLASYKKELWNTINEPNVVSAVLSLNTLAMNPNVSMSEMDTSFSDSTSEWLLNKKETATMFSTSVTDDENVTTLQEGILPSSLPTQVEIGDKKVMIFQAYDNSRDILNGTVLMYSVEEDGVWSEPKPVHNDGYADMYADMKIVNDKVFLVWQKIKEEVKGDVETDSESVMEDYAANSEICLSVFDETTNTFSEPAYVTNNTSCDMMPQICENTDEIVVSWVKNDELDLTQQTGTNQICSATWDGTKAVSEAAITVAPGTVDNYVVYQNEEEIQSAFVGQSNGLTALFDTNGNVLNTMSNLFFSSEEGTISKISCRDGKIYTVSNGVLYSYSLSDGYMTSYKTGESDFGNEIEYCTNGDKSGYIWSVYDENANKGMIYASMQTENGFSEPIVLYEQEGTMWRTLSPTLDADGKWHIIANAFDTATELNSLCEVEIEQKNEVELVTANIKQDDVVDGLTAVEYHVVNTGDTAIDTLDVAITLENGDTITKTVSTTIQSGENELGTVYVDLSDVQSMQNVELSITAKNQEDLSECTLATQIGQADISVLATHTETEDNIQITATLTNQSSMDANTVLHLYSDETKTQELDTSEKISVSASDSEIVTFTVDKEDVIYNENEAAYLTLQAVTEDGDYKEDNNSTFVVLYKNEAIVNPTPTPAPTPTPIPTPKPTVSPTIAPTATPTASPTIKPTPTASPTIKPTPTVEPTNSPTDNSAQDSLQSDTRNLTEDSVIRAGDLVTQKKMKYKVTKIIADGGGEVSVVGTTKKKSDKKFKALKVGNSIKIDGNTFKITSIGPGAFYRYKYLNKITIGKNVTKIDTKAFYECKSVKKLVFQSSKLKSVGIKAIYGINKKAKIKVPKKVLKKYKKYFRKKTGYKSSMRITK